MVFYLIEGVTQRCTHSESIQNASIMVAAPHPCLARN
jgi:hypothetical protein